MAFSSLLPRGDGKRLTSNTGNNCGGCALAVCAGRKRQTDGRTARRGDSLVVAKADRGHHQRGQLDQ